MMRDNVLLDLETLLTEIQTARERIADELRQASLTDIHKAQRLFQLIEQMAGFSRYVETWLHDWMPLNEPKPAIEDSEIPFPPPTSEEEEWDDSETDSSLDDDEIDESTAKGMFGKEPLRPPPEPGLCTPQKAYRLPILEVLCELGGAARRKDVLSGVFSKMKGRLLPQDKEKVPSGRAIRWKTLASFERKKMVQEGLLAENTPRIWQITDKGRAELERLRDGGGDE